MQLAFITPTTYLEKFAKQGDMYLALAHLIDDNGTNEYARFHRRAVEQGKRVILDNGLFEGAQVSTEQLLQRAAAIKAQCVCAPDVLFDSKGTIKEFKQFIRAKQEFGLVSEVMGIPQANNPTDWWECFHFMQNSSDCDIVGLSILSIPESFDFLAGQQRDSGYITGARVYLIRQLYALSSLSDHRLKPMHLLGLGDSYDDVREAIRLLNRDIVSNDSSSAFIHGAQGIMYTNQYLVPGGKDPKKLDFGLQKVENEDTIQRNIDIAKHVAAFPWYQYSDL